MEREAEAYSRCRILSRAIKTDTSKIDTTMDVVLQDLAGLGITSNGKMKILPLFDVTCCS